MGISTKTDGSKLGNNFFFFLKSFFFFSSFLSNGLGLFSLFSFLGYGN